MVTDANRRAIALSFWSYQHLYPEYGRIFKNLLVQNVIIGCTILFNRHLLDLALPVPKESVRHDWWLALVAAAFGQVGFINTPTLQYRQHGANSLGAKPWAIQEIINTMRSERIILHGRIQKTWQQAEAFHSRYAQLLPPTEKESLDAYTQLNSVSPYLRRIQAIRHGFRKNGLIRTLGFYWTL